MFFNLMIAAGSETTRNAISAGLLALMERPELWTAPVRTATGSGRAVEEMLRWSSATTYNRQQPHFRMSSSTASTSAPATRWCCGGRAANFDERVCGAGAVRHRPGPEPPTSRSAWAPLAWAPTWPRLEMRLVHGAPRQGHPARRPAPVVRTRSNKHSGFRHVPVHLVTGPIAEPPECRPPAGSAGRGWTIVTMVVVEVAMRRQLDVPGERHHAARRLESKPMMTVRPSAREPRAPAAGRRR
jgi:hypothetical protein